MNRQERRLRERTARRLANDPRVRRNIALRNQQEQQRTAALPLDGGQVLDLVLYANAALSLLATGQASDNDLHALAALANVTLLFAERGLGEEFMEDILASHRAIVSMFQRFERTGRVGASGTELQATRQLVLIHEAQMEAQPTRGEMREILHAIKVRQQDGHAVEVRG